jgi:Ca2+-transporting ATPase
VEPLQKLRLVNRLKENNEIVAVTGDGVNDAPALKSAHIGAAMGAGTDVAKDASDMVITDNNFASVYAAVREGRTAFRNIRMATFFLLSTGAADILIILSALVAGWPLPLLPAQILWCNVVTNGIADVALAFEPGEQALYDRSPRPPQEGVLNRVLLERLVLMGIWLSIGTLVMFWWKSGGTEGNLDVARTAALTTLVLFQKVHVFNCRSESVSIFKKSLLKNKILFIGVLTSLGIHIAALYMPWTQKLLRFTPLDALTWVVAIGIALTAIIVNELHKHFRTPEQ